MQHDLFVEQHATVIRVADFPAMVEWYTTTLGLSPVRVEPEIRLAVFDVPGVSPSYLCLYALLGPLDYSREDAPKCLASWRTADIEGARAGLQSRGVECGPVMGSDSIRVFTFHDPEGTHHDCVWFNQDWLPGKHKT